MKLQKPRTERDKRRDQQAPRVPGQIFTQITIGSRIRYARELRGMKQVDLSARTGLTQAAVSNLETDTTRKPSSPSLLKIASALDVNPDWILTGLGEPTSAPVPATAAEIELMRCYRRMPAPSQAALVATARAMAGPDPEPVPE